MLKNGLTRVGFLRYVGNTLAIIGYFTLLWGDTQTALILKVTSSSLVIPFVLSLKLWDVLLLLSIFGAFDMVKLFQLTFS